MYHLGTNTDRIADLAENFSESGKHTIAVDGSGPTVDTWLPPAVRAKAKSLGILNIGEMCSQRLIEDIVGPSILEAGRSVQSQISVIVDAPHFPARIGGNGHLVPKLDTPDAYDQPFVNVMSEMGIPVLMKGDGDKTDTSHKIRNGSGYQNVWEQVENPDLVDGLKTHYFHDGKSAFNTTMAARAAAEQAGAAIFNGVMPMPEPDIDKYTSIDAGKTAKSYLGYYEVLMRNLQELYPDYDTEQLGRLMATKLGPVEDGEHTNGPADRWNPATIQRVARDTSQLISQIHEISGIRGFRMLTNGRPLGPMIQVINRVNQNLNSGTKGLSVGPSFSSSQMKEAILRGAPVVNGRTKQLEFENRGLARDFHGRIMEVCGDAAAGKLDSKDLKDLQLIK